MSRKKKVLITFHLCFVFSYLFWIGTQSFVRQVTATKAASLLLDSVTKNPRFDRLEKSKQLALLKGADQLKKKTLRPVVTKFHLSTAGVVWAAVSLFVCFFLLFHIEGAHLAAWLLPLTVVVYAFSLARSPPLKGETIFPREEGLVERYIEPGETFKKKRDQLSEAWNRYLLAEWGHGEDLEAAVFYFNVERAFWVLDKRGEDAVVAHLLFYPSLIQVLAYFLWNLVFAWRIHRYTRFEARSQESLSAPV